MNAAREVLGERGLSAPLEDVAARAGVGTATLYRRFPTKTDLIEEAFEPEMRQATDLIRRGLGYSDPWQGFIATMLAIGEIQAAGQGFADLFTHVSPTAPAPLQDLAREGSELFHQLVTKAQQAGGLRSDFTAQDVVLCFMANAGVLARTHDLAPTAWRRMVGFVLDGLRADAMHGASTEAPTEDVVWEAMSRD